MTKLPSDANLRRTSSIRKVLNTLFVLIYLRFFCETVNIHCCSRVFTPNRLIRSVYCNDGSGEFCREGILSYNEVLPSLFRYLECVHIFQIYISGK